MKRTKFNFVDDDTVRSRMSGKSPILQSFADALRRRPGKWAEWPIPFENSKTMASWSSRITKHSMGAPYLFRNGFESAVRGGVMYVRYIGGDQ